MDRRDAVKRVAIIMGGALSATTMAVLLEECRRAPQFGAGTDFTADETQMVDKMSDIIIPRTATPGARDAGVPAFIVMMIQECFPDKAQTQFHAGLQAFNEMCRTKYGKDFLALSPTDQTSAVKDLDSQVLANAQAYQPRQAAQEDKNPSPLEFYRTLKELTLLGYFTSKPGATEELRYVAIPGRYDGCVPYHQGDKAWAT